MSGKKRWKWGVGVLLGVVCVCGEGRGQAGLEGYEGRRVVEAVRLGVGETIELDGRLDEAVWQRAQPAGDFVQIDPDNGSPATEATQVYVVYDANRLYMGVICYDSEPEGMLGNTMQRDAPLGAGDRFMWVFDTYLDERSGYFFEINPSGAMGDQLISSGGGGGGGGFGGGDNGRAWNGIWTAKVVRSEMGWVAEIEMPFRTLNFDPQSEAWGINFQRTVRRKNEESIWNGYARNQNLRRMSNAGLLVGLSEISQGMGLDVKPYFVGKAVARPGSGEGANYTGDVGGDLIYSVTPSLRANFTINTDFAETEVDDRQVNLTRFPLRFPEKREFFLEGSNFFDFSGYGDAFFSRRIGLNQGTPQRIDYGVKLTGQVGAQDIGLLQVRTGEEGDLAGEDFTVVRGRRRFLSESHVGMLYTRRAERAGTVTDPSVGSEPDRHTVGVDMRMATRRFLGDKNLTFTTHYLTTSNPDGTGHSGRYGASIDFPNDLIDARLGFDETQVHFDPAVGFVQREGVKNLDSGFQFRPRPANSAWIRQFTFGVNFDRTTDSANRLLERRLQFTPINISFQSGDFFNIVINRQYERLDTDFEMDPDFETGEPNIVLPEGSAYHFTRYGVRMGTSNQRFASLRSFFFWGDYLSGTRRDWNPELALRPRTGLLVELSAQLSRIELPEGRFSTKVLRGTLSTQFSPWISLSNNLQYDTQSRVIGWQARFRWILKPGNDLFFVYTQNWLDDPAAAHIETIDRQVASKLVYTHRF